jgi:hypothetical protein
MSIHTFNNIFLEEELKTLRDIFKNTTNIELDPVLGRRIVYIKEIPQTLLLKVIKLANSISNETVTLSNVMSVEYNNKYGKPNLPVHFDGDTQDVILNFQLSSNISWDLGVNCKTYQLEDNSAVAFNPNLNSHWRPKKDFKDGDYVAMIFFRFQKINNKTDYSHLRYSVDNPIFKEANDFRDSLNS